MLCLKCRYSLAALPRGVCPECGRAFDPTDPATFYVPRMLMLSAGWSRAPDRGHFVMAALASFVLLSAYWSVATNMLLVSIGAGAWLALLVTAMIRAGMRLVPPSRHRLRLATRQFWRPTSILALAAGFTVFLVWFEAPLKVRYLLSYPSLRAVADELAASECGVIDLQSRGTSPPGAIAAFKIAGGQAIEVFPPVDTSWVWNDPLFFGRRLFQYRSYRGVARIPNRPARTLLFREDPGEAGLFHAVELDHMWGDWYLFRWKMFGHDRSQ